MLYIILKLRQPTVRHGGNVFSDHDISTGALTSHMLSNATSSPGPILPTHINFPSSLSRILPCNGPMIPSPVPH